MVFCGIRNSIIVFGHRIMRHDNAFPVKACLNPGADFPFNAPVLADRADHRHLHRGFYPAIEYVYGEHVEGYGGGVCQASTTLYQAAVCAGLQILKREPHSDSVSYTDYGKDATVYWVGKRKIDLTFKNNTEDPIYIIAAVQKDPTNKKRLIAKERISPPTLVQARPVTTPA